MNQKLGICITEIIYALALSSAGILLTVPLLKSIHLTYHATLNLQKMRSIVNYARSIAITQHAKVLICPTLDQLHCSQIWEEWILVLSPKNSSTYALSIPNSHTLSFRQSGYESKMLTIEANGMTNHNGHFNYSLKKHHATPQFKLYFNRALRIYVAKEGL